MRRKNGDARGERRREDREEAREIAMVKQEEVRALALARARGKTRWRKDKEERSPRGSRRQKRVCFTTNGVYRRLNIDKRSLASFLSSRIFLFQL